ncbi:hypothetical protein BKA66DRAFT_448606 [Pyrenochaeta sp. MPI-SDFR-AT-0127]|nr:hypothetical protein BKA66DRAFT_448606 [Pyrenochaeta sp. MPI-SDFR-AT-0127]
MVAKAAQQLIDSPRGGKLSTSLKLEQAVLGCCTKLKAVEKRLDPCKRRKAMSRFRFRALQSLFETGQRPSKGEEKQKRKLGWYCTGRRCQGLRWNEDDIIVVARRRSVQEGIYEVTVTNMIRNMSTNLEPIDPETSDHEPTGDEVADMVNDLYAGLSEARLGHD